MISVLCPLVNNFDWMMNGIQSLYRKASAYGVFEFIAMINPKEIDVISRLNELPEADTTNFLLHSTKHEYEAVNLMCRYSSGDKYMLWDQTGYMDTKDWDLLVEKEFDKKYLTVACSDRFPIITEELFRLLGHFALSDMAGEYITIVSKSSGILKPVKLTIDHRCKARTKEEISEFNAEPNNRNMDIDNQNILHANKKGKK